MGRPKSLVPKLCIDRTRNRAFCKIDGRFVVLGPAGSPEAQAAYGRLLRATQLAVIRTGCRQQWMDRRAV